MGGQNTSGERCETQAKKCLLKTLPYFVGAAIITTQLIVCQEKNIILEIFYNNFFFENAYRRVRLNLLIEALGGLCSERTFYYIGCVLNAQVIDKRVVRWFVAVQTTAQASENDQFAAGAICALLMAAMARSIVPYDDLGDIDARLN